MDDDERTDETNEMNTDNDAREEDIVEDTDADAQDVEETEDDNNDEVNRRLSALEDMLGRVLGSLDALRDAQSIMVENGATIMEDTEENMNLGVDNYEPPAELDLSL
jgi:hypothetical protein